MGPIIKWCAPEGKGNLEGRAGRREGELRVEAKGIT